LLLERGANANLRSAEGKTPLFLLREESLPQIAELLINNGAQVNIRDNENSTPLHTAVAIGSVETAELMLSNGAEINAKDDFGWTPLCVAAMHDAQITGYLISRGANVNPHETKEKEGCPRAGFQTPLHYAVRSDSISTVKVLVENGAFVNVADEDGVSPLHVAVANCNFDIADYLIGKGAYLNLKEDKYGRTEIHTAAIKGQGQLVERLIGAGARVDVKDNEGKTPLDYARYHGFKTVAEMLETYKAPAAEYSTVAPDILNNEKIKEKEAIVWYLGHSGWAIKTQNHLLIFDYSKQPIRSLPTDASLAGGYIIPSEIKNENAMVFVSHDHGDHYDPGIFQWRNELPNINYVIGFRPRDIDQEYVFTAPHSAQEIEGVRIYALRSNDSGVGFLIEVDGLTILHPGDHANGSIDMSGNYTPEIDALATMNKNIDLAFSAILGCSIGTPEAVQLGVRYAIEHLKPKVLFPMHAGHASYLYRDFVEAAADENYDTQLTYALNEGDRFLYRQGTITKIE
jgi:ankyrin repeat protein